MQQGRLDYLGIKQPHPRYLVVKEVRQQEQVERCPKVISQERQGKWMRWEEAEKRKFSWKELLGMEADQITFTMWATYDVLQSPQ